MPSLLEHAVWNANWGIVKGGDLDSLDKDGKRVLRARIATIEMGRRMGVYFNPAEHGFGQQYVLEDLV